MDAIQLNGSARHHPYACRSLVVTPNPPQVGVVTTLALRLTNPGPGPIVVNRIEMMVARFGMGVGWEELPAIGPLHLPEDRNHIEEVSIEWTPTEGGHRCVRAAIHVDSLPLPLRVGRNLEVLESTGERAMWRVPFRLGNPTHERAPV